MSRLHDAVLVAYGRTAYAKAKKGSFARTHPIEFAAQALKGVLDRVPELPLNEIEDLIVGCALPQGVQGNNLAKLIAVRAGLPDTVSAQTLNRFCASGLQAVATAANAIRCGEAEVLVAGGAESMSLVPMYSMNDSEFDPWLLSNAPDAYMPMGLTAERVAQRYHITRSEMEQLAVESHRRAAAAQKAGCFTDQIVPITVIDPEKGPVTVTRDEGIRPETNLESLAALKPCFQEDGLVTAATSSPTTDGAGFLVLMSAEKAAALGIEPIARLVCYAIGGVPAAIMGIGPTVAVPKVLKKAGLSLGDMDTIELNEAFASQALACVRTLGMDPVKVNPEGGALALGHPLGATGAMLTCKALSRLARIGGRYGLVTMCIGGGMGAAGVFELLSTRQQT